MGARPICRIFASNFQMYTRAWADTRIAQRAIGSVSLRDDQFDKTWSGTSRFPDSLDVRGSRRSNSRSAFGATWCSVTKRLRPRSRDQRSSGRWGLADAECALGLRQATIAFQNGAVTVAANQLAPLAHRKCDCCLRSATDRRVPFRCFGEPPIARQARWRIGRVARAGRQLSRHAIPQCSSRCRRRLATTCAARGELRRSTTTFSD
jgi:hypothetical protein